MAAKKRSNKKVDPKINAIGLEKLKSSGLDLADAKKLHISILSAAQTSILSPAFKDLCSLKIEYYDHKGKPLADWPEAPPFFRLRYLEVSTGFDSITDKKTPRYVQPPDTAPVAYYPQNYDNWSDLCADADQPLIITEGELKAAKACKEGFPTLGLGGVYSWRSNKLGITWLDSLNPIEWRKRNVYICFDSDYQTNPNVCKALRVFAEELQRRGSFCFVVTLPKLPGLDKVGLDDFLVASGPQANTMFMELLSNAEPLGLSAPLWSYNDQYCYIRNPGFVIDQSDFENKISPSAFKEHLEASTHYQERQLKLDGTISYKTVSAAAQWLKWPLRFSAKKITYQPGAERFSNGLFNSWPGWGCEPKKGDVKPFLKLVDHIFTGAEKEAKRWFLQWCAYPIQNPGVKMFSSAVVHGIKHGTGKSLIGYSLGKIYGKNFGEISQLDIHNNFNEWAENKQLILGDDVTGSNRRADADFLKKMITQFELRLNPKHIRSYVVPDCINYYFTSNHPDAFFLEDDDRRYFIHEVFASPLPEEFYTRYYQWLKGSGASALFHYMLNLDLKGFNPAAPAYRTMAKERMIDSGRSDLAIWVRQLIAVPDNILRIGDVKLEKDLFSSKELLELYDTYGKTTTTANGMARELSRAGLRQVADGNPVKLSDGSQARYYAVKRPERWLAAKQTKIVQYLNGHLEAANRKKKKRRTKKY